MSPEVDELPRRIGPYRITGVLGRGGMGVVYGAVHQRLERPVALKRLLPDLGTTAEARARFLREARTAARLNHPAVVQVYDVLEDDEGDWIVMERVDGDTLARRALERPLELAHAVELGRQVASGLAAAHCLDLVHRDLKSENVMVTVDGAAKMLDFGLAKPLLEATTAGITVEGRVLGTCRSMSPEQASGRRLDARSDLFSFGTLLYETLTGTSPFLADSLPATLHRVCTHAPPPVAELNPDVPPTLSELVDRLLEKDPTRRPQSAGEVAEALAALGGAGGVAADVRLPSPRSDSALHRVTAAAAVPPEATVGGVEERRGPRRVRRRRWSVALVAAWVVAALVVAALVVVGVARHSAAGPPVYVAVAEPEVTADGPGIGGDLLRTALRDGLLEGLFARRGLRPLVATADRLTGGEVDVAELASALAADEVLRSAVVCGAEACDVRLSRVRGEDGSLLWSASFRALRERPDLLAEAAMSHLRQAYPRRGTPGGPPLPSASPQLFADFVALEERLRGTSDTAAVDRLLSDLAALRRQDPDFLAPYLLEARWRGYRFHEERDGGELERGLELLADARRLAPRDPRPLEATAELALAAGDLELLERMVAELEARWPGSADTLSWQAELAEQRGDGERAVALLRDATRLHPGWRRLHRLARLEIRLGEVEAARATLETLLTRFPDSVAGLSSLAQLELLYGSLERAVELYRRLVERSDSTTVRNNLGLALLLLGRPEAAEGEFRAAWEGQPDNPQAALNLADTLQYQGRGEAAAELYRRVLDLLRSDPAGGSWVPTVRAQALARLGRREEAVAEVQAALRRSGDNPQILYEAALVYALVGDRSSALVNALAALEGGVQPRWFGIPGFDSLRREPSLRRALATAGSR